MGTASNVQNNNWIRKRLEDSRNKLGGFSAGPSSSTEVFEVFTVRNPYRMPAAWPGK